MIKTFIFIFILLAFGCASGPTKEQYLANLQEDCRILGVTEDTEEFRNCVIKLHEIHIIENAGRSVGSAAIVGGILSRPQRSRNSQ